MIWTRRESFGGLSNDACKSFKRQSESVVEYTTKTSLNRDSSHAGTSFRLPRRPKEKKAGRHFRRRERAQAHSLSEQPVADMSGTVPCEVCGHPVDRKRLQAHMVRFHGMSHT
jgi:hypothetical protein